MRLARDGLAVAVNSLHGEGEALDVVGAIRDHGGVADSFAADATDGRAAAELVAAVTGTLGSVDVLVLDATGPQPEAPLAEVTWEDHVEQLEYFVKSPILLGRAVLPAMRAKRHGRIVQIDSDGRRPATASTRSPRGSSPSSATPRSLTGSDAPILPPCPPAGWEPAKTSPTP